MYSVYTWVGLYVLGLYVLTCITLHINNYAQEEDYKLGQNLSIANGNPEAKFKKLIPIQ